MKFTSNPDWFKESDESDFIEDELDLVESEELDEPENEEDALALSEANGETYVDDEGNERYVGNHHLVDKNKQAPTPAKKEQPKKQEKPKESTQEPLPSEVSKKDMKDLTKDYYRVSPSSQSLKDALNKGQRVRVTFKNDYGDDVECFWYKDKEGLVKRELYSHRKPVSGDDYWSRDTEDDDYSTFTNIDDFIQDTMATVNDDPDTKVFIKADKEPEEQPEDNAPLYNDGDEYYHQRFGRLTYDADNDDFVDSDGDHYDADSIDFDELEPSEEPELDDDEEDDGWRPPMYRR